VRHLGMTDPLTDRDDDRVQSSPQLAFHDRSPCELGSPTVIMNASCSHCYSSTADE
jgi:hypothetical protein